MSFRLTSVLTLTTSLIFASQAIVLPPDAGNDFTSNQVTLQTQKRPKLSCSYKFGHNSQAHYNDNGHLSHVVWLGNGTASCTVPVRRMFFNLQATSPSGTSHPIASGFCNTGSSRDRDPENSECMVVFADKLGYVCQQSNRLGERCDGDWQVQAEVEVEAWEEFDSSSVPGSCSAFGRTLSCFDVEGWKYSPAFKVTIWWFGRPVVACDDVDSQRERGKHVGLVRMRERLLNAEPGPSGLAPTKLDILAAIFGNDGKKRAQYNARRSRQQSEQPLVA
ncbi:hypothetical protein L218DRAFT_944258 [Marasmius fiardii PR-910]|nr:hypothetical protein L218DRAFT_944258 [Marasmius fiardii PR-910]